MEDHEVQLIDYIRILWRQKWVIVVTVVASVVAAWGASRATVPIYQTETSLLLLPPLSSHLDAESIGVWLAPEAYEKIGVSTNLLRTVLQRVEHPDSASVQSLKGQLSVSITRLSSGSELLLNATIRGSDPDQMYDIAGAWTASFTEMYGQQLHDRVAGFYAYVSENCTETQATLEALIEERTSFLDDHPLVAERVEAATLETTLASISMEILRTRQELETAQAYLAAREQHRASQLPAYDLTGNVDPYTLAGALVYGLSADEYGNLMESRLKDLERTGDAINNELAAKASLTKLDREISLLQQAHERLAIQMQNAEIVLAETADLIQVVDEPFLPSSPIVPKKSTNIAIAGFMGLVLGTLFAFFVDYLLRVREDERTRVASPEGSMSEQLRDDKASQQTQSAPKDKGDNSPT